MAGLFVWTDYYSVGDFEIDRQHKSWIAMINNLHRALLDGKGEEVINDILNGIVGYADTHFRYEEAEMLRCDYPDYEPHKKQHDDFEAEIKELHRTVREDGVVVTQAVLAKMSDWLINHITKSDKLIAPYVTQKKAA